MAKITANFSGNEISSNSAEAFNLFSSQRFGERVGDKIRYMLPEAFYLAEKGKLEVLHKSKKLPTHELLAKLEKPGKNFKTKYAVFKDLRSKGHIVKSALKFGAEFRVYEKGSSVGEEHAKWIVFPVSETETCKWSDFVAKNRIAHSTKKNLLIAIVDEEGDVVYYEVSWLKP